MKKSNVDPPSPAGLLRDGPAYAPRASARQVSLRPAGLIARIPFGIFARFWSALGHPIWGRTPKLGGALGRAVSPPPTDPLGSGA